MTLKIILILGGIAALTCLIVFFLGTAVRQLKEWKMKMKMKQ